MDQGSSGKVKINFLIISGRQELWTTFSRIYQWLARFGSKSKNCYQFEKWKDQVAEYYDEQVTGEDTIVQYHHAFNTA